MTVVRACRHFRMVYGLHPDLACVVGLLVDLPTGGR